MTEHTERRLTGRHVLAITLGAFGVIVAVNLTMAALATGSFPGLVVGNSYVASQDFDAKRAKLAALGWDASLDYADGKLRVVVSDGEGRPVRHLLADATVGRPAAAATDRKVALVLDEAGYSADLPLEPGRWKVSLTLDDGTGPVELAGALVVESAP